MFTSPYATTPCVGYSRTLTTTTAALAAALIRGELSNLKNSDGHMVPGVFEVPPYLKSVPPYTHPVAIEKNDIGYADDGVSVVVDTRAYVRVGMDKEVKVASPTDYNFLTLYARLVKRWMNGYYADFRNLGAIAPTMYIRWLSETIVAKLNLNPYDQVGVTAVTGYFFFAQFINRLIDDAEKLKISHQVARHTQIPAPKVLEYIDLVKTPPTTITEYIHALRDAVETSRFEKFTPALLYQIMAGSWFPSAREVVAVALEYPPAFYTLVYSALTDRGFHKTLFAERLQRLDRNNAAKEFSLAVARFIEV